MLHLTNRRLAQIALLGLPFLLAGCPLVSPDTNTGAGNDGDTSADNPNPVLTDRALRNTHPTATAGADLSAFPGDVVVLNGTTSSDEDGDQLFFVWQQIAGEKAEFLSSQSASIVRVLIPEDITDATTLTFSLTVGDGFAAAVDTVRVSVEIPEE